MAHSIHNEQSAVTCRNIQGSYNEVFHIKVVNQSIPGQAEIMSKPLVPDAPDDTKTLAVEGAADGLALYEHFTELAEDLEESEKKGMINLFCSSFKVDPRPTTSQELFESMIHMGKLRLRDFIYLQCLLWKVGRKDLFKKMAEKARGLQSLHQNDKPPLRIAHLDAPDLQPGNGYSNVMFHLMVDMLDIDSERLRNLRVKLAVLLGSPQESIALVGVVPDEGAWVTVMPTVVCEDLKWRFDDGGHQNFLRRLSIDSVGVFPEAPEGLYADSHGRIMLVVAIDFGTTYSGCAFSLCSDYQADPTKVHLVNFKEGSAQLPKTPTCILFTPEQEFHSFGTEAEDKYATLCDEDSKHARKWYFFQKFKLALFNNMFQTLSKDLMLPDETKKKAMPALKVFSTAIGYMKGRVTEELRQQGVFVPDSEITWVLTVPAIWDDGAKDFMREAAQQAGIPEKQLELALEPEAASVYCKEFKASQTLFRPLEVSQSGKKFLLVDCGGGTIDISAFKTQKETRLQHLHRPEGSCQGGTRVDDAFKEFLHDLMGTDGLASIDKLELLHLMREFEKAKRSQSTAQKIAIKMPGGIKIAVEEAVREIAKHPDRKRYELHGKIKTLDNVILLDRELFLSFFQESATSIPRSIRDVLADAKVGSVDAILLAGGFSESDVIQDAVKKTFPRDQVLVAPDPSAAILTGAVMYGHNPQAIATRVSAFTYGVGIHDYFKDGVHDVARLVIDEKGDRRCKDCFNAHITIDQEVEVNTLLPYLTYYPPTSDATEAIVNIYRSTKKKPLYLDEEGSEKVGTVTVLMPDTTGGRKRKVKTAMMVGGTELKFFAKDETTQVEFTTKCDFLSKN